MTLGEKCPNTEFFLVRFFPHSECIPRDTPYLSVFSPNEGQYGPEETPYLDTFHAVWGWFTDPVFWKICHNLLTKSNTHALALSTVMDYLSYKGIVIDDPWTSFSIFLHCYTSPIVSYYNIWQLMLALCYFLAKWSITSIPCQLKNSAVFNQ